MMDLSFPNAGRHNDQHVFNHTHIAKIAVMENDEGNIEVTWPEAFDFNVPVKKVGCISKNRWNIFNLLKLLFFHALLLDILKSQRGLQKLSL
jgi:hypothetical protein